MRLLTPLHLETTEDYDHATPEDADKIYLALMGRPPTNNGADPDRWAFCYQDIEQGTQPI